MRKTFCDFCETETPPEGGLEGGHPRVIIPLSIDTTNGVDCTLNTTILIRPPKDKHCCDECGLDALSKWFDKRKKTRGK